MYGARVFAIALLTKPRGVRVVGAACIRHLWVRTQVASRASVIAMNDFDHLVSGAFDVLVVVLAQYELVRLRSYKHKRHARRY